MKRQSRSNILNLRDRAIHAPSRLDLAAIEVQMAWPHDRDWQKRAYMAIVAEHMTPHIEEALKKDYRGLHSLAKKALPIADVRREWNEQAKRASLAGLLLHDLVGRISLGITDMTMEKLISRVIEPFMKTKLGGELRISVKTFQNQIWPAFRCVAYYWAASFKAREFEGQSFPCNVTKLREFLADAEAYRLMGEASRTKRSPSTVLNPNETMKLPSGLLVEPSIFSFEKNQLA